jgi:hypothetical protein
MQILKGNYNKAQHRDLGGNYNKVREDFHTDLKGNYNKDLEDQA